MTRQPYRNRPLNHQWRARKRLRTIAASFRSESRNVLADTLNDIGEEIIGDYRQRKIVQDRREQNDGK